MNNPGSHIPSLPQCPLLSFLSIPGNVNQLGVITNLRVNVRIDFFNINVGS